MSPVDDVLIIESQNAVPLRLHATVAGLFVFWLDERVDVYVRNAARPRVIGHILANRARFDGVTPPTEAASL
jgi:hypothetical protein